MRVWGASLVVGDGHGHGDVAAGGVGVGANLVGCVGQRLGLVLRKLRNDDLKLNSQAKALALASGTLTPLIKRLIDHGLLAKTRDALAEHLAEG